MINKRDMPKKCKDLLDRWKENLNLTNYERTKFKEVLYQLDLQISKLERKELQISVYGRVGVGKSSLLNALIEKQIFPTDIINGNTKTNKSYQWCKRFKSLKIIANSFTRAILISLWVFSITLEASATFIELTGCVPAFIILLMESLICLPPSNFTA